MILSSSQVQIHLDWIGLSIRLTDPVHFILWTRLAGRCCAIHFSHWFSKLSSVSKSTLACQSWTRCFGHFHGATAKRSDVDSTNEGSYSNQAVSQLDLDIHAIPALDHRKLHSAWLCWVDLAHKSLLYCGEDICVSLYQRYCVFKFKIADWLTDLRCLYSAFRLKPKFHYTIQYGSEILRHGPIRQCWKMRHESRYSLLKGTISACRWAGIGVDGVIRSVGSV